MTRPDWALRKLGAAAFVLDPDGRVLLVHHAYGRLNWEIPGGASEADESVVETALRELREEVGVDGVAESLTGIYYDAEDDAHHFVFRCRIVGGDPAPASAEVSECGYWHPDALPRPISDFTVRRIEDALAARLPDLVPVSIPPRSWLK
jgi:8-oxo-dGTP diphosphatase